MVWKTGDVEELGGCRCKEKRSFSPRPLKKNRNGGKGGRRQIEKIRIAGFISLFYCQIFPKLKKKRPCDFHIVNGFLHCPLFPSLTSALCLAPWPHAVLLNTHKKDKLL